MDLHITFCNVGQGDTIIVQWTWQDRLHIGIVDAKQVSDSENPAIQFLEALGNIDYSIDFILFTHSHTDHFSGSVALLEYLTKKKKDVIYYLTPNQYDFRFLNNVTKEQGDLFNRYLIALEQYKKEKRILKPQRVTGTGQAISLIPGRLQLRLFSPSAAEVNTFQAKLVMESVNNFTEGSQAANYLATVTSLESINNYILLTSDSQKVVFKQLAKYPDEWDGKMLCLAQVPHHGSKSNYFQKFWQALKKYEGCPAVVSVGANHYEHPSEYVLTQMNGDGFRLYFTNQVNGANEFLYKLSEEEKEKIRLLDTLNAHNVLDTPTAITVDIPSFG